MTTNHTKGPWNWNGKFNQGWYAYLGPAGSYMRPEKMPATEAVANANLISTAPELLEELVKLVDRIEKSNGYDQRNDGLTGARSAIAKATKGTR